MTRYQKLLKILIPAQICARSWIPYKEKTKLDFQCHIGHYILLHQIPFVKSNSTFNYVTLQTTFIFSLFLSLFLFQRKIENLSNSSETAISIPRAALLLHCWWKQALDYCRLHYLMEADISMNCDSSILSYRKCLKIQNSIVSKLKFKFFFLVICKP